MPIYRSHTVLEVARGIKAFLNLEVGFGRGAVLNPQSQIEQLRKRLSNKNRQLKRLRKQLRAEPSTVTNVRGTIEQEKSEQKVIVGDPRDHYIGKVVKGKSFADVGGLWSTVNEKVSVAHSYGAAALAMVDTAPQSAEQWRAFSDRMRHFGVSDYDALSESILGLADAPGHPRYDVVHCSDVLHHMPEPMRLLSALHKVTREHLVLGSVVTATQVDSRNGTLKVPSAAPLFVPALRGSERAILEDYWRPLVGDNAVGLTREQKSWQADDFDPWWWLPTVDSMKAMCASAGFDCEEGTYYWNEDAYVLLLSRRQG